MPHSVIEAVRRHKRRAPTPEETLHLSTANTAREGDVIFVPIPGVERLDNEETLRPEINGEVMTIARIDNRVFAIQEFCTHRFGPLSEGTFHGFDVQCPWHKSRFDGSHRKSHQRTGRARFENI